MQYPVENLDEKTDFGLLTRDIAFALTQATGLPDCLRRCAEALVRHLDAAFARIWTVNEDEEVLELQASAGMYTHLDGPHSRIPLGQLKIGRIARDREPHLTNQVIGDPRVSDQDWARREGMIAFAGYPLICNDRVAGVMALFSRHELARATLTALDAVAGIIATGIGHWEAVDALRATEERFELAIQGSGAGLWDWNLLTGRVDFAPRFKELLGYKVEELDDTFASFETRLHPEDHVRVLAAVADHLERRVPYAVDYRLQTKSGEYRWFHARGQAVWNEAGKATRMLGSITDITDRKRSEERFRLLVEASPDALVITDQRGVISKVNAQTEKLFGYRREELLGQAVEILVPDRGRAKHVVQTRDYAVNPHVRPMGGAKNLVGRHRDGHEFPVEISLSPVETEEGLLIAAAVRDISERKQAEHALRESEERFARFMLHLPGLAWIKDSGHRYVFANDAALRAFRHTRDGLCGKTDEELFPAETAAQFGENDRRALASEGGVQVIETLEQDDGAVHHSIVSKFPIPGRNDQPAFVGGVAIDITDLKRAECALRESEERTRSIIEHVVDGIITIDATGTVQLVNPAVGRIFGYRADELLGRNVDILMPEPYHGEHDRCLSNRLRTGQPKLIGPGREVEGRRKDGTTFPLELSVGEYSLDGTHMFTGIVRDITIRKQRRQRLAAEHEVARILAESGTFSDAAPRILEAIAGNLGWEVGARWELDQEADVLRCASFWHAPSFACPRFEAVSRATTFACGVGLPGRVWESGKVTWMPDVTTEGNFPRASAAAEDGLHWGIALPIITTEGTLGVIDFYTPKGEAPDDLMLQTFERITGQITRFVELRNAEQHLAKRQAEVNLAKKIQVGFFPRVQPVLKGFSIAGATRPALETGGDYFDFIPVTYGRLMIPLGDVSGHGLGPAMVMAETRAYIRAYAAAGMPIDTIMTLTSSGLIEDTGGDHFVTLFLSVLNPSTRSLIYKNAGQGPGYVFDGRGELKSTLESTDLPLGIDPGCVYEQEHATVLESGDLVLLMTDGILEACCSDGRQFGAERAIEVVLRHRREEPGVIIEHLIREACVFCRNVQADDMTAVVIKVE